MSNTKKLCFTAMMIATGILLPLAFHAIPNSGAIFSPMHLPVFIAGFLCGPFYGGAAGMLCPLLSFLFTGMPAIAMLPNMLVELLVYGTASGLFFRIIKTKNFVLDLYISLIISMLAGRVAGGVTALLLFLGGNRNEYSWTIFFTTYFVTCWPAILIQLLVVPSVAIVARKTRFISENDRYLTHVQREKHINKQRRFFDNLADGWRRDAEIKEDRLKEIFGPAKLEAGDRVLDAGCGAGVLEKYLLNSGCKVDAIDVSEKMIDRAKSDPEIAGASFAVANFYGFAGCGEAGITETGYDKILVFDAYPHFCDKAGFAEKASELLRDGGVLYIAFDEGRDTINGYHKGGGAISVKLKKAESEVKNFKKYFSVFHIRDDKDGYEIGLLKNPSKIKKIR